MQYVCLFRFVEVLLDAPNGATLQFLTDLPGDALAVRRTVTIPATTGRHPYRVSLPGSTKGKLYQIKITPTNGFALRLYQASIYARLLGPQATPWTWHAVPGLFETPVDWQPIKLPIEPTSDAWQQVKLPIEATPDAWQQVKLPIEATPDEWQQVKLPIEATPDAWQQVKLPIEATPDAWSEVKLPIESTPDAWQQVKLPIENTPDAWSEMKLPVKETPVVPAWVPVQVDE